MNDTSGRERSSVVEDDAKKRKKYLCIHGHFYQPPRENPWLEVIEVQDSAAPFHDWNERINRECYAPNSVSRRLDEKGRVARIQNNFENISFNIGPTLFSWLETHDPYTYRRIIGADEASRRKRNGHGSAIAQVYNHMIMPLASPRDRETQIKWGIADFVHRFGHQPEGMWLAETAVCRQTLQAMADEGILFTILCQRQAKGMKEKGETHFTLLTGAIDPTRPYRYKLDGGKEMALFFYDGPISQAVAFEGLLQSGEKFANRLASGFSDHRDWPQLLHIATDGETFGHHHRFGEMALTYALDMFEQRPDVELTTYGQYLSLHPPEVEVEIHENSSWSCAHGVERWRSDCGCAIDPGSGWSQSWRGPLRQALDYLKNELDRLFEQEGQKLFDDPWRTRNHYGEVILDRTCSVSFLKTELIVPFDPTSKTAALRLLEMQRSGMLMYTSCGWFFDDISGIETVQLLKYADRAIQIFGDFSDENIRTPFLALLAKAKSNLPRKGSGDLIYRREVAPDETTLAKAAANYAIMRAVVPDDIPATSAAFAVAELDEGGEESGDNALAVRRLKVGSTITGEESLLVAATLRIGAADITCFCKELNGEIDYDAIANELLDNWRGAPLTDVIRLLDRLFEKEGEYFYLKDLFTEDRRRGVRLIAAESLTRLGETYRKLFTENRRVVDYFIDADVPLPREFKLAAQYILERELALIGKGIIAPGALERLADLMNDVERWEIPVNLDPVRVSIEETLCLRIEQGLERRDENVIREVMKILLACQTASVGLDLWRMQNRFTNAYFTLRYTESHPFYASGELRKLGIMLNFS